MSDRRRAPAVGHIAPRWGILTLLVGACAAPEPEVMPSCERDGAELDEHDHALGGEARWDAVWLADELHLDDVDDPGAAAIGIVDWPIPYDDERKRLTVEYLRYHAEDVQLTGDLDADVTMVPRVVVLHWTAGPTAKSAWHAFAPVRHSPTADPERAVNLSTQFIVDRDGTIYRLFPEDLVGRHTIGLNHVAIGVENVGGGKRWPLTRAQEEANIALVRYLAGRHPITHVIGHHEYRGMEGHPYFREVDPDFRTFKCDPGVRFMEVVRDGLADLDLEGAEAPAQAASCRG